MSKIKNGGLDQYGTRPFELQQIGPAGVEGLNMNTDVSMKRDCDFEVLTGMSSVQAFGISEEEISKYVGNGIICWGDLVTNVLEDIELRVNQTRDSETTSLVTILLEGYTRHASTYCLHCVSKNDTDIAHYNFNTHQPILVIFGRDVAERVCYQTVICYPTSPN